MFAVCLYRLQEHIYFGQGLNLYFYLKMVASFSKTNVNLGSYLTYVDLKRTIPPENDFKVLNFEFLI